MSGLDVAEVDTATLGRTQRTSVWESFNARRMVRLECRTLDDGVVAHQLNIRGPDHAAIHIEAEAHTIVRGSAEIAEAPVDRVQVSLIERGEVYFWSADGMHRVVPGELLFLDTDRPYSLTMPSPVVMRSLHVPRAALSASALTSVAGWGMVRRPTEQGVLARRRQLERYLDHRFTEPRASSSLREPLGLIEALLTPQDLPASAARFAEAIGHIDARLGDPSLRPSMVATAMHLSERQLARVFADHDTTFGRVVLDRRLDLLAERLSDPRNRTRRVGDLIMDCGFTSVTHGHRRFSERTGMSPGRYRARPPTA